MRSISPCVSAISATLETWAEVHNLTLLPLLAESRSHHGNVSYTECLDFQSKETATLLRWLANNTDKGLGVSCQRSAKKDDTPHHSFVLNLVIRQPMAQSVFHAFGEQIEVVLQCALILEKIRNSIFTSFLFPMIE